MYITGIKEVSVDDSPRHRRLGNRISHLDDRGRVEVFKNKITNTLSTTMTYESYHLAISNKLGWGDMLAEIALPAINKIITNFLGMINERTGDVLSPEDVVPALLENYTADDIFGLLGDDGDPNYLGSENEKMFISLRYEIEEFMRIGFTFEDARRE